MLTVLLPLFGFSQTGPGGVGTTDGTSSLEFWISGDAGTSTTTHNAPVGQWDDRSGNNRDVTATGTARSTFIENSQNGLPEIRFDGIDDQMTSAIVGPIITDYYTIYVVQDQISSGQNEGIFSIGASGGLGTRVYKEGTDIDRFIVKDASDWATDQIYQGGGTTAASIIEYKRDATNIKMSRGGGAYFTGGSSSGALGGIDANTQLWLASQVGSNLGNLDIAEIILFSHATNTTEKIIIENYLEAKWDIDLATNDIYDEDDAANGDFDFDVAGIGRVDASNLHDDAQGTGIVRILNPSGLDNDEFLIWGHDNGTQQATEATDVPSPVQARFDRVWRASEVNSSSTAVDVGSVDVRFDLTGLGAVTALDLRLLVDTDNDGVFNDETPIGGATALGGNVYEFAGVSAIANNLRFTLGTTNTSQTPLPIELINFTTNSIDNKYVKLEWQTASEINNDYFTIERSQDGFNWEEVRRIDGAGNSSNLLSYSTIDKNPYYGISYYRLKQTDFDGQFEYSQIESINIKQFANSTIVIFPNPTESLITLIGDKYELEQIKIYNTLGQDVTTFTNQSTLDNSKLSIDLSNLSKGMYYIITKTNANKVYKQ